MPLWSIGSIGMLPYLMAKMMQSNIQDMHDLPDYTLDNDAQSEVGSGGPLPLGTQDSGNGVIFSIFSRYATRVRLQLFEHPGDSSPQGLSIWIRGKIEQATCGIFGSLGLNMVNSMLIVSMDLTNQNKGTVSTSTSFLWTLALSR